MAKDTPAKGRDTDAQHEPEKVDEILFDEEEERQPIGEHLAAYREKRRTRHRQFSIVDGIKATEDSIAKQEARIGQRLSSLERSQHHSKALQQCLTELDAAAAGALPLTEDEEREKRIIVGMRSGDTRLTILRAVASAETESDPAKQKEKKQAAVALIQRTFSLSVAEASSLYDHYAANPDIYEQVVWIEQARAVLDYEPERFDEFVALIEHGDQQGVDKLFAKIAATNEAFSSRIATISQHRQVSVKLLHLKRQPAVRISAMLGDEPFVTDLTSEQQLGLASALEFVDQPILESWRQLPFSISERELSVPWLGSMLHVRFQPDDGYHVYIGDVPVTGGLGHDFFDAAVISRSRDATSSKLPLSAWQHIVDVASCIGPKYESPVADQIRDGVRLISLLGLDDLSVLKRYGVLASDQTIDHARLYLLREQVKAIVSESGIDDRWLNVDAMTSIADQWEIDVENNRKPTVLPIRELPRRR